MTTQIARLPVSHVDHGLTEAQLAWLLVEASARLLDEPPPWGEPYIASFQLPEELGTVPCGLHGPRAGDHDPVEEDEVTYAVRGSRTGESRLCARAPKQTRKVSLIAGEHEGEPWVLFTAFGGPVAPREPFELAEGSEERAASEAFWAKHALSG